MREYEIVTILSSQDTAKLEETKKNVKEILERHKVEIVKEDDWGTRRLQYEMKHQDQGAYSLQVCKAAPETVKEITHDLDLEIGVINYMIKRVVA